MRGLVVAGVTLALTMGSGAAGAAEDAEGSATEAPAPLQATSGTDEQPLTFTFGSVEAREFEGWTEVGRAAGGDGYLGRLRVLDGRLLGAGRWMPAGEAFEWANRAWFSDDGWTWTATTLPGASPQVTDLEVRPDGSMAVAVGGVVAGNVLRDVTGGAPIVVRGPATPLITGNTVAGSTIGISVGSGTEVFVRGNELIGNEIGIATRDVDEGFVGNTIIDGGVGVAVESGAPYLEGNVIGGNRTGIEVGPGASPRLVDNTVCDNETNVRLLGDAQMPDTARNDICPDVATEGRE